MRSSTARASAPLAAVAYTAALVWLSTMVEPETDWAILVGALAVLAGFVIGRWWTVLLPLAAVMVASALALPHERGSTVVFEVAAWVGAALGLGARAAAASLAPHVRRRSRRRPLFR